MNLVNKLKTAYAQGQKQKQREKTVAEEALVASLFFEMNEKFISELYRQIYQRKIEEEGQITKPEGFLETRVYGFGYRFA